MEEYCARGSRNYATDIDSSFGDMSEQVTASVRGYCLSSIRKTALWRGATQGAEFHALVFLSQFGLCSTFDKTVNWLKPTATWQRAI